MALGGNEPINLNLWSDGGPCAVEALSRIAGRKLGRTLTRRARCTLRTPRSLQHSKP